MVLFCDRSRSWIICDMALGSLYGPEVRKLCRVPSTVLESATANCEAVETRKGNQVSSARQHNSRPPERRYKVAFPIIKSVLSSHQSQLASVSDTGKNFWSLSWETASRYSWALSDTKLRYHMRKIRTVVVILNQWTHLALIDSFSNSEYSLYSH